MDIPDHEKEESSQQQLKKQLALAVRSIHWSYAIFWSISPAKPGRLKWSEGYFNGEIKTTKTVQSSESKPDELGLQRGDELRELYEFLLLGEIDDPSKRPAASLTPEDLSNAEWYFLVCMSFEFQIGQGLPGKAMAENKAIWFHGARYADVKSFPHSVLAESAAMKTIVCFPHSGGVVELGATQLVKEDLNLIHHVKVNFLTGSCTTVSENPENDTGEIANDHVFIPCEVLGHDSMPEVDLDCLLDCENMDVYSPNGSDDLRREEQERNLVHGFEGETASEMLNWDFMDDDSLCNSSDRVSQTDENRETIAPQTEAYGIHGTQECNQNNTCDMTEADMHYMSVLSCLQKKNYHQLTKRPFLRTENRESSFVSWNKNGFMGIQAHGDVTPQRLLKKVLIEVPKLHEICRSGTVKQSCSKSRQEADENDRNHVLSERKRREKINGRFRILGSLIPSGSKANQVSVLDHTIEYIKKLEGKLEALECYKVAMGLECTTKGGKTQDAVETNSDNSASNKRSLCETDKRGGKKKSRKLPAGDVAVHVSDKDVLIEITCSWTESMIVEVIGAASKLRLEIRAFESSRAEGILSMTLKANVKGLKAPSASVVKKAIHKVISNYQ